MKDYDALERIKSDVNEAICRAFDVGYQQGITSSNKEIQVGDEVKSVWGNNLGVIIKIGSNDKEYTYVMWTDGSCGHHGKEFFVRTGRNFPQIEQVLNLMKGGKEE